MEPRSLQAGLWGQQTRDKQAGLKILENYQDLGAGQLGTRKLRTQSQKPRARLGDSSLHRH